MSFRYIGVSRNTAEQWDNELQMNREWKPMKVTCNNNKKTNHAAGWYWRKYWRQSNDVDSIPLDIGMGLFQVYHPKKDISYIFNTGFHGTDEIHCYTYIVLLPLLTLLLNN